MLERSADARKTVSLTMDISNSPDSKSLPGDRGRRWISFSWIWTITLLCLPILLAAILLICNRGTGNAAMAATDVETRIQLCETRSVAASDRLNPEEKNPQYIQSMCLKRVDDEDQLERNEITTNAFRNQQSETRELMWLVVIITASGVIIAGMQLVQSYKLVAAGKASADQSSKIDIEVGKLSVSSSVTGILILVVSFAFFYIFTKEIYTIHGNEPDKQSIQPPIPDTGLKPLEPQQEEPAPKLGKDQSRTRVPHPHL